MTIEELSIDLREKEEILEWLVKNRINTVDGVGRIVAAYYSNREALLSLIRRGKGGEVIQGEKPKKEIPAKKG